jgi:hypothetical protein
VTPEVRVPDILQPVIVRDISMEHIRTGWDEFVRLVASIEAGTLSGILALDRWKQAQGRNIEHEILRHNGPAHFEGVNFRGKFDFPMHQYQERLLSKARQRE